MILFLTLKVFSATGGIEKVCRIAGKALYEHSLQYSRNMRIFSMYGPKTAAKKNPYFPAEIFCGFGGGRSKFVREAVAHGRKADVVILSHINLMLAAWLIKLFRPSVKIVLIAHGIEVWKKFTPHQKLMFKAVDHVIAVSNFTAEKMIALHSIPAEKISVINNCIDPFLAAPERAHKNALLMSRYGFLPDDIILLTLTRLSEKDRYKGYDNVLKALASLVKKNSKIKYLLAGGYDGKEKIFIDGLVGELGLSNNVVLAGFIKEDELPAHFQLADIYVMPSVKEGFGIVFVEAMYYGAPAIAANADGSVDALLNGALGLLIDPDNPVATSAAIEKMIAEPARFKPDHGLLMKQFSYDTYKERLEKVLETV